MDSYTIRSPVKCGKSLRRLLTNRNDKSALKMCELVRNNIQWMNKQEFLTTLPTHERKITNTRTKK